MPSEKKSDYDSINDDDNTSDMTSVSEEDTMSVTSNINYQYRNKNVPYFLMFAQPLGSSAFCRNAVTGNNYGFRIGSKRMLSLFRVIDAWGAGGSREPYISFYDSPTQWKLHRKVKNKDFSVALTKWQEEHNACREEERDFKGAGILCACAPVKYK